MWVKSWSRVIRVALWWMARAAIRRSREPAEMAFALQDWPRWVAWVQRPGGEEGEGFEGGFEERGFVGSGVAEDFEGNGFGDVRFGVEEVGSDVLLEGLWGAEAGGG